LEVELLLLLLCRLEQRHRKSAAGVSVHSSYLIYTHDSVMFEVK